MLSSRLLKLLVPGLALAALAGCDRQSGDAAQPGEGARASASAAPAAEPAGMLDRSQQGKPLPDITLKDAEGRTIRLASLAGRPVLINLWATWCAPCIAELPTLDQLAGQRGEKLKVLTVSQDLEAGKAKVAPFLKARGTTRLEPWLDPQGDMAFAYGAGTLPVSVLYDASGREVWRWSGGRDWTSAETARLIDEGG